MAPQAVDNGGRNHINNHNHSNNNTSAFLECVVYGLEHTVDILGCDEQTVRERMTQVASHSPLSSSMTRKTRRPDFTKQDYAKLHDEFIESLLQEQENLQSQQQQEQQQGSIQPVPSLASSSSSSIASDMSPTTPAEQFKQSAAAEAATLQPSRRRRPLKLSRRSPAKSRGSKRQVLPMSSQQTTGRSSSSLSTRDDDDMSMVSHITKRSLPVPSEYLLENCRLQKDKGKGEPIGSDICATNRSACLHKLRSKMELLTQVAASSLSENKRKGSASMKRRKGKVTEETGAYTETRSVMDLRMGFLSMQYGVLLRWDTRNTGKVLLVVLRKMCHESFYRKDCIRRRVHQKQDFQAECHDGNHYVVVRPDGAEVTLLGEPYRVERPLVMAPTVLDMKVVRLDRFSERSTWTVQVVMSGSDSGQTSRCQLRHGIVQPIMADKSLTFQLKEEVLHVEFTVLVYEQKRARQKKKRLVAQQPLLFSLLDVSRHRTLEIPNYGSILFSVLLQSAYVHWLHAELKARRGVPEASASFYPVYIEPTPEEEIEQDGLWDLCCVW